MWLVSLATGVSAKLSQVGSKDRRLAAGGKDRNSLSRRRDAEVPKYPGKLALVIIKLPGCTYNMCLPVYMHHYIVKNW